MNRDDQGSKPKSRPRPRQLALLEQVQNHLENAVHGKLLDEHNRDEGGIRHYPDTKHIFSEVEKALALLVEYQP